MIPVVPAKNTQKHNAGRIFGTSGNIIAIRQQNKSMNFTALAPLVPFFDTSGAKMDYKKHHFWHQSRDLVPVVPLLAPLVPHPQESGVKKNLLGLVQIQRNFPALNPYNVLVFGGE